MKILITLYRLSLFILLPIALPILYFLLKKTNDHTHFAERIGIITLRNAPCSRSIWFHAASVGEVRSIKKIIDELRIKYPSYKVIISTFTKTGRAEALDYLIADESFLIPFENHMAVSHIMKLMGVKVFVVVDTEIWPNMIYTASEIAPLIMINARMSDKTQKSYKKYSFIFGKVLARFSLILTKSKLDTERFTEVIGSDKNVTFAGNIKFAERKNIADIDIIDGLKNTNYFLIASTHPSEETTLLTHYNDYRDRYDKLVIAPRHIKRSEEIAISLRKLGYSVTLYSENDFSGDIVIIDAFGQLERLYAYAEKIFIGGSLVSVGGHNIYEALQFKQHVYTGSNMRNFQDIFDIALSCETVTIINDSNDISTMYQEDKKLGDFEKLFHEIDTTIAKASDIAISEISNAINEATQKEK